MSDQQSSSPEASSPKENHWQKTLQALRQYQKIIAGTVVVVLGVVIALSMLKTVSQPQVGIVYPLQGQAITSENYASYGDIGQIINLYSTFSLNKSALTSALRINGQPATVKSMDGIYQASGVTEYQIGLDLNEGDVLSVLSAVYNQEKGTITNPDVPSDMVYNGLQEDLSWAYTSNNAFIDSYSETDNSEVTRPEFELFLSGNEVKPKIMVFSLGIPPLPQLTAEEKTEYYYTPTPEDRCQYSNLKEGNFDWSKFQLRPFALRESDDRKIIFSLSEVKRDDSCYFVALQDDADAVVAFYSSPYTAPKANVSLAEMFNPDQDFKSIVNIEFSTPYFDTKKKRDRDEELAYRGRFKQQLAKLVSISPAVDVNPDDITLYAQKAMIPLQLKEKMRYEFTLKAGADVFGETFPQETLEIQTGELKYLGLRQKESQTVFMANKLPSIDVLHYAVPNPTVRLCRVDLEGYAKVEHIGSRRSEYDFSEQFLLEGIDQLKGSSCQDKLVTLEADKYRTALDLKTISEKSLDPGLYFMTFAFQGERKVSPESPANDPLFFSIVDAHISMKLSKNGQALFWVNDFQSGKGVPGLTLTAHQNIFTASEGYWDNAQSKYIETFNSPLDAAIYSEPVELGKTDADGFLSVNLNSDDYYNAFQTWYDDPSYRSLIVTASGSGHMSFVGSKWNSGIADWNFGFQPESYDSSGMFSAHLFTDRKLYKPGEIVHFKAIIREQAAQLSIPKDQLFDLVITDPQYEPFMEKAISVNDFGSYSEDITVPVGAALGTYTVTLKATKNGQMEYIRTTDFSVEEFQKPTFKVEVAVNSPELEADQFADPKITEEESPWGYRYKVFEKNINLKAEVNATYYAGGVLANAPFTYTVFKQNYYDMSFWGDCFYGCYWEPYKEYYTQGESTLDANGKATVEVPVTHTTSWEDYRYIVEVAVDDPSAQRVAGSGSVIAKIPESLRQSNPYISVELSVDRQFVAAGETIALTVAPERKWDSAHNDRYQLTLKRRQYTTKHDKQTGGDILPQVDFEDQVIVETKLNTSEFELGEDGKLSRSFKLPEDGEYLLTLEEVSEENTFAIRTMKLYAYTPGGITNAPVVADNKIAVVIEKPSYHLGEKARLLVRLPFADAKALVTLEKKNVVSKEVMDIKGNTLIKEYTVDDTFVPNAYISIIAFKPGAEQPEYKVGYAEVVVDKTDKKLFLEVKPNADTFAPRDQATIDLLAKDRNEKPVQAELTVAVVDEALIAILGNIDLDILPKFFQKIVFQTHTALTNVAMWKQLYFARKGVVGGSGGKEGGDSIFTRSDFKNTAFYAASVVTDSAGRAKVTFALPDNIGEFRIITIGHSKNNFFGAAEKTISVRQEVVVEETFPLIVRRGDDMRVGATVYNNSSQEKSIAVSLDADGLSTPDNNRQVVAVKAGERQFVTWRARVDDGKTGEVRYTITAIETEGEDRDPRLRKGDRIEKSVVIASVPMIANRLHVQDDFEQNSEQTLQLISDINPNESFVELSFSTTILAGVEKIISSLLQYPYGCIEQTISSTLPNAIVKKFQDMLDVGIDDATLQKNLDAGIKRFASMQVEDGGFAYWEGGTTSEPHITPYAVLALVEMRDLGVKIPREMIDKGRTFIEDQVKALQGNIPDERLSQLVQELHALSRLDSGVFGTARTLLQNRLEKLTTHEKIVYGLSLAKKDVNNYRNELEELIGKIDLSKAGDSDRNWYWDSTADRALYVQLLIRLNPQHKDIPGLIKDLYALDLGSYYYSTQSKAQVFIAFADFIEKVDSGNKGRVALDYQIGNKKGKVTLTDRAIFRKLSIPMSEIQSTGGDLKFTVSGAGGQRVYTDLLVSQIPKDPTTVKAQQDKGIKVTRQYYKLGAVKETDNGWWKQQERDLAPVSGASFKLGETYLVKVKVDFDKPQRQVALESFLPASFKLINTRFLTEQTQVGEDQWNWPFYHEEFRADRYFASAEYVDNYYRDEVELSYYVRPIVAGEFLEPPVSVYPMYRPDVEGHTEFRRVTIEE